MSLLPFLIVTGLGAIATLMLRDRERIATRVGIVALFAAVVASLLIRPSQIIEIGSGGIATTDYLRLFLVLGALAALLLAIVGEATGSRRDAPAVALGILATSALALSLPDPRVAVLAATAGGAFGALVALTPVGGRVAATVGTRVLRAAAVAGTMAIAATAWFGRDLSELAAQPIVFGLAYLAFELAVAIRFGAIPAHTWAARLTDAVPETTLPLVTAIAPAALAIVALAWVDASVAPLALDLGSVRIIVLAVAVASIVLGSIAAWIQEDIEHVVGYAIVSDAGVIMLAIAALDPAAWAPARKPSPSTTAPPGRPRRGRPSGPVASPTCVAGPCAPRSSPPCSGWSSSRASACRVWRPRRRAAPSWASCSTGRSPLSSSWERSAR